MFAWPDYSHTRVSGLVRPAGFDDNRGKCCPASPHGQLQPLQPQPPLHQRPWRHVPVGSRGGAATPAKDAAPSPSLIPPCRTHRGISPRRAAARCKLPSALGPTRPCGHVCCYCAPAAELLAPPSPFPATRIRKAPRESGVHRWDGAARACLVSAGGSLNSPPRKLCPPGPHPPCVQLGGRRRGEHQSIWRPMRGKQEEAELITKRPKYRG